MPPAARNDRSERHRGQRRDDAIPTDPPLPPPIGGAVNSAAFQNGAGAATLCAA
jgi:hypothetical protein